MKVKRQQEVNVLNGSTVRSSCCSLFFDVQFNSIYPTRSILKDWIANGQYDIDVELN